jgi:hypothetical protein
MHIKKSLSLKLVALTLGASATLLTTSPAADQAKATIDLSKLPPAAAKQGVTYAGDIKAILDKSCVKCHGAEKPKAKLRLDSLEGVLKGGEDGKVITPGDGTKSMLLISVARIGPEDSWMPPKNNKANIKPLSTEQVGLIRAWIEQGAK